MRITGGSARGRVLKVPDTGTVRPTSDKMRQQIFNMLNNAKFAADFDLVDARVLDGFCGSGALGIEALSRGAAHVTFVDMDRRVLDITRGNVSLCGFADKAVFVQRAVGAIGAGSPCDLVLLDPPYRKGLLAPALSALHQGGWLAEGAIIVCETERGWRDLVDDIFVLCDMREGGDSQLNIWQYRAL